jgi:HEXXH motif-containing protein
MEVLSASAQASQRLILGDPTMAYWEDVASRLFRSPTREADGKGQPLAHLRDLGRFALATALHERKQFRTDLRLDAEGRLHLPGLSAYLQFGPDCAFSLVSCSVSESSLHIAKDGEINVSIGLESVLSGFVLSSGSAASGRATIGRLPVIGGFLTASNIDPNLRLHRRVNYEFEDLDGDSTVRWVESLNKIWDLIEKYDSPLAEEMRVALRVIVPVKSPSREEHLSATFRELHGAMYCSWTPDLGTFAGALVHEFHHLKLNLILDEVDIFESPRYYQLFYSPWRVDPRPLSGILHGAYSFLGIARFLDKIAQCCPPEIQHSRLQDEVWHATSQVETALATLHQHASLTSFGQKFLAAMASEASHLLQSLVSSNYSPRADLVGRLAAHRQKWEALHKPWSSQADTQSSSDGVQLPTAQGWSASNANKEVNDPLAEVEKLLGDLPADQAADTDRDTIELDWTIDRMTYLKTFDADRFASLQEALSPSTRGTDCRLTLLQADLLYVNGFFERAVNVYLECLHNRPFWLICWLHLGFSLRQIGYEDASNMILLHTDRSMALFADSTIRPGSVSGLSELFNDKVESHEFRL